MPHWSRWMTVRRARGGAASAKSAGLAGRQTIISFELKKQHKAFALRQRSKSRNHCFCEDICDITSIQAPRLRAHGIIMSTAKFEPFGELLPENGLGKREQPKASAILSAVGQGFFWLL